MTDVVQKVRVDNALLERLGFPPRPGCFCAVMISERLSEEQRREIAERHPTRENILAGVRENVAEVDPEQFVDDFFLVLPEWPTVTKMRKPEAP